MYNGKKCFLVLDAFKNFRAMGGGGEGVKMFFENVVYVHILSL
jgi:hypothetical protein